MIGYREAQALKQYRAEEQEKIDRPIREAEAALKQNHAKLLAVQRDTLLNPKVQDVDLYVDPVVRGGSMPREDAVRFNVHHAKAFFDAHPEIAPSDRNLALIGDYYERHGIALVTSSMIEGLVSRMQACGVAFDAPAPKPQPAPQAAPVTRKPVKREPETITGRDYETGMPRQFSPREVERMSSEEFKRAFRVLPDVGALFTAMQDERNQRD